MVSEELFHYLAECSWKKTVGKHASQSGLEMLVVKNCLLSPIGKKGGALGKTAQVIFFSYCRHLFVFVFMSARHQNLL